MNFSEPRSPDAVKPSGIDALDLTELEIGISRMSGNPGCLCLHVEGVINPSNSPGLHKLFAICINAGFKFLVLDCSDIQDIQG
mgnify:CR=1 FL=1